MRASTCDEVEYTGLGMPVPASSFAPFASRAGRPEACRSQSDRPVELARAFCTFELDARPLSTLHCLDMVRKGCDETPPSDALNLHESAV